MNVGRFKIIVENLPKEKIIHMASKCHPTLDMLYMIKHDTSGLEVTLGLHALDQITTTAISMHIHLE